MLDKVNVYSGKYVIEYELKLNLASFGEMYFSCNKIYFNQLIDSS